MDVREFTCFAPKTGKHTHPATHPHWIEFTDGDCVVCVYQEARGWLLDCSWPDITPDEIRRLPAAAVKRAVERHYAGGWAQFIVDAS